MDEKTIGLDGVGCRMNKEILKEMTEEEIKQWVKILREKAKYYKDLADKEEEEQ